MGGEGLVEDLLAELAGEGKECGGRFVDALRVGGCFGGDWCVLLIDFGSRFGIVELAFGRLEFWHVGLGRLKRRVSKILENGD